MWHFLKKMRSNHGSQSRNSATTYPDPSVLNAAPRNGDTTERQNTMLRMEGFLYSWLLDARPSQLELKSNHQDMILGELKKRLDTGTLEEFPRQPGSLPRLMQALADTNTQRDKLTGIIQDDPALTDQLMHLVNSPYFRTGGAVVDSVDQAVFKLGIDGIRGVASAALLRPIMAARGSHEALFAQRAWRWGLACSKAVETTARLKGQDTVAHAMVGLLPALAYLVLRREVVRIYRTSLPNVEPEASVICAALKSPEWTVAQMIAEKWQLPPRFHAHLLAGQRPAPNNSDAPLNDGMIIGTREVLRHARQRNLSDETLSQSVSLDARQLRVLRESVLAMLDEKPPLQERSRPK